MLFDYQVVAYKMDRNIIGYMISSFGLVILTSAIMYPLGYLESVVVFRTMISIGTLLIGLGLLIRSAVKK